MSYRQSQLVDEYIAQFDGKVEERLIWMRRAIQLIFPKTIEDISYGIPTYRPAPNKRGVLHFGASKDHIGLYGVFEPKNDAGIHKIMSSHRTGRGTLQFKHNEPLPKLTIRKVLIYHAGKVNS